MSHIQLKQKKIEEFNFLLFIFLFSTLLDFDINHIH